MSPEWHLAAALSAWEIHGSRDTLDGLEAERFLNYVEKPSLFR